MNSKLDSLPDKVQILCLKHYHKILQAMYPVTTYHCYCTIPYTNTCTGRDRGKLDGQFWQTEHSLLMQLFEQELRIQ